MMKTLRLRLIVAICHRFSHFERHTGCSGGPTVAARPNTEFRFEICNFVVFFETRKVRMDPMQTALYFGIFQTALPR